MRVRTLSIPFADWPGRDRAAWERALAPAESLFDDEGGAAERFSAAALKKIREAYSVWLSYLVRSDQFDPDAPPASRVTRGRLNGWIADQRSRGNGNTTIYGRLRDLHAALKLIAPEADLAFILRPGGRSLRRALRPRPRWAEVRDSRELLARALALFEAGRGGHGYAKGRTAVRDAALLGLLAAHAPRIRSVGAMAIGDHVVRTEDGYSLHFGEKDTKTQTIMTYDLNPELVEVFDHYITRVRPTLCGSERTACLWVGTKGKAVSDRDLGKVVRRRTMVWFGREEGPHWFRKCLRTTASLAAPEMALHAAAMLGHGAKVSIENYTKAKATQALRRQGARISELRSETWSLAASAFGWRDAPPPKQAGPKRPKSGNVLPMTTGIVRKTKKGAG